MCYTVFTVCYVTSDKDLELIFKGPMLDAQGSCNFRLLQYFQTGSHQKSETDRHV